MLALMCFTDLAHPQSPSTRIKRIEIDSKTIRPKYQVYFLSKNSWIKAMRTPTGFLLPKQLKDEKSLTIQVVFGKYKLWFPEVNILAFQEDWTIGVDTPPFSEDLVPPDEASKTKKVWYIKLQGDDIGRTIVMKET
jgi:hypothetical protein